MSNCLPAQGLQPALARGMLSALVAALRRVYLDGGPTRCGIPSSMPADSRAFIMRMSEFPLPHWVRAARKAGCTPSVAGGCRTPSPLRMRTMSCYSISCVPCRLYTPADVPMMQADLEGAQALFHADGDGLPAEEVAELCKVRSDFHIPILDPCFLCCWR